MKKRYKVQQVSWKDGTQTLIRDTLTNRILTRTKTSLSKKTALQRFKRRGTLDPTKIVTRFKSGTKIITKTTKPTTTHQLKIQFDAVVAMNGKIATIKPTANKYYTGFSRLQGTQKQKIQQAERSAKAQLLHDYPQIDYSDPVTFMVKKIEYISYKKISD